MESIYSVQDALASNYKRAFAAATHVVKLITFIFFFINVYISKFSKIII